MKRGLTILISAGVAAAAALAVAAAPARATSVGCRVDYAIGSQWPTGFTATVTLTNLGSPLSGWTLGFDFTAGQHVSYGWSAAWSQSGTHVSATNASWNGTLGTGAAAMVGFSGTLTGANPVPAVFTLNGVPCDGTVTGGSPSPSPSSASPSASHSGAPGDQPPTVRLTSPDPLDIYGEPGNLPLAADASDSDGTITKVEFYTGVSTTGPFTLVATVTSAPYTYTLFMTGPVTVVRAVAYDNAGLTAADTESVKVAVSDPIFMLTSPNSTTVYREPGTIQLAVRAEPANLFTKVEFYTAPSSSVPLTLVATVTAAPYTYLLTVTAPDSVHIVEAKGYEVNGQALTSGVLIHTAQ